MGDEQAPQFKAWQEVSALDKPASPPLSIRAQPAPTIRSEVTPGQHGQRILYAAIVDADRELCIQPSTNEPAAAGAAQKVPPRHFQEPYIDQNGVIGGSSCAGPRVPRRQR